MRTRLALGALVLAAACLQRSPLEADANAIIVHAVLDVSARDQYIVVQTTPGNTNDARALSGAVVILTLPDGREVRAAEESPARVRTRNFASFVTSSYHLSLDKQGFELVPGATYHLRITAPDGRVVTGHTTIPATTAQPLTAPSEPFDHTRDTLRLSWPRVAAARSYEVTVLVTNPNNDTPNSIFADTTTELTGTTKTPTGNVLIAPGPYLNRIAVAAVDTNYYDYYRRTSDLFTGVGVVSHLDGAQGFFGSMVVIRARTLNVF